MTLIPPTLQQSPTALNIIGAAGFPFAYTVALTSELPWDDFSDFAFVVERNGAPVSAWVPTITTPDDYTVVLSWSAAQTTAMGQSGASVRGYLFAETNSVPQPWIAGVLQFLDPSVPGVATSDSLSLTVDVGDNVVDLTVATGAYPPGIPVFRAFPFSYATADLENGVVVYTPTVNEVLYDAWFQVNEAFNGTTPNADIGQNLGSDTTGWFYSLNVAISLDTANAPPSSSPDDEFLVLAHLSLSQQTVVSALGSGVPGFFSGTSPLKLVVSQDGTFGGAPTGATEGSGVLYLVTVIPTTL